MAEPERSRTNEQWLRALKVRGLEQEAAIVDLRNILLRATLLVFSRNNGDVGGLGRHEVLQLAEDCAQDALLSVMDHLEDFRGDSKFTTWAYKFAINTALMASRHQRWKGTSLDEVADSGESALSQWVMQDKSGSATPEQSALQGEAREVIRSVIEGELTEKQRRVLFMMVLNEVPMDEVVRHLGVDRNAVYKMLHDARRKVKSSLQARGFEPAEMLSLFGAPG